MPDEATISKFDRLRGSMHNVALFTKPSTIKNVQTITGESETFVIESCRFENEGDYVFIECVDKNGVTRIALPPKVADVIASQRDALTARRRSRAAKRRAEGMTAEDKQKLRDRFAAARKNRKRTKRTPKGKA